MNVPELLYHKPLSNFGYALNEELKVVICTGCHRGVPTDMLKSHSKTHHPGRSLISPEGEEAAVLAFLLSAGYRTSKAEKYHQPPGQKPVDGLEVFCGFSCPFSNDDGSKCARSFRAQSTFSRHLSDHPESRGSNLAPASCASPLQTLFNQGGLQNYFSVQPSLSLALADPSSTYSYGCAVEMLEDVPKPNIPLSNHDKDQASIHWFTRWPQLLEPYIADKTSIQYLRSLVSFPDPKSDPEWLLKLLEHGARWWKEAENAHMNCSFNASAILQSHEE